MPAMKQNLHTHTTFCDGKDTPEQLVLAAIEKGLSAIGFSGHSYNPYSVMFAGKADRTKEYQQHIRMLQQKYRGKIDIYCGLEVEAVALPEMTGYDFLIGSAHYFYIDNECIGFDRSPETVQQIIGTYFNGSSLEYARRYFETLVKLPQYGKFDILAHFDIHAKNNERIAMFDENDPKYLSLGFDAIDALAGKIPFFEVNTGSMARGYRSKPYPAPAFIRRLNEKGFGAVITSDCHDAKYLDYGFDTACALLAECGFREYFVLTDAGFQAVPLEV